MVFAEPPGSYDLCPICFWEDDALQLEFATTLAGGANSETLLAAQRHYLLHADRFPDRSPTVRWPGGDDQRDPLWRPIDPVADSFPAWDAPRERRPPDEPPEALYYWHPAFWRR